MKKHRILVLDEDVKFNNTLSRILSLEGHIISRAFDIDDAIDILNSQSIDILLLDTRPENEQKLNYTKQLKDKFPSVYLIVLSTNADIRDCVSYMKNGANDYIVKDKDLSMLLSSISTLSLMEISDTEERDKSIPPVGFNKIIGNSDRMKELISLVKKAAVTNITVLLQGETGTGKELFAEAIHNSSERKDKPFVALNCATFSHDLLESELFGYVAGAFTGAVKDKKGILEEVNGGTLFLDEIGEMNLDIQAKLLRILESGDLIKVGDNKSIEVDIRFIVATHKDLSAAIMENSFRQDLFYRLNMFSVQLPPLRERKQDIPLLADYFIKLFSKKLDKLIIGTTKEYENRLINYFWKGNIRELKNIIERSVILAEDILLTEDTLPYELLSFQPTPGNNQSMYALSAFERSHIYKILILTKWNKIEAARLLNISLSTLYRKIEEYTLSTEAQVS